MLIKKPSDIRPSEITDEGIYQQRRRFLGAAAAGAAMLLGGACLAITPEAAAAAKPRSLGDIRRGGPFDTDEEFGLCFFGREKT